MADATDKPIRPVHHVPTWAYMSVRNRVAGLDGFSTADLGWAFACRLAEDPGLANNRDLLDLGFDVRCVLGALTDFHWNRFSRACARESVTRLLPLIARLRADLGPGEELTVADIGCGSWHPYAVGFLTLLGGADRAWSFDMDEPKNHDRALWALSDLAAAALVDPQSVLGRHAPSSQVVFDRLQGFDLARLARADAAGLAAHRLRFERRNATDLGLAAGSVSLTRSLAFFEHVTDVDGVIAELARITRRGGLGFHHIDAVDHRSYNWPSSYTGLDYLAHPVPGEVVELPTPAPRLEIQNRVRPHEWVARFEAHGFRVETFVPMRPVAVDEAVRARFIEPYRSMTLEQLAPTAGDYLLVRA